MANNENEFRKLIEKSARSDKTIHLVPIPDDAKRMLVHNPELAHLVEEKVYDLGMLKRGRYCAVELKNVTTALTFNTELVKPHQVKYLKEAAACGGYGRVLVRFKKGLKPKERKRLTTCEYAIDKAFSIDINWMCEQPKSIPIETLIEAGFEIPQNEFNKLYDLKVLWPKIIKKKTIPKKKKD